jgi:hypothetical protein
MPYYKLIKNNKVVNTIVAVPQVALELEEDYDSVEEYFITQPETTVNQDIVVSAINFKLLWKIDERIALKELAASDLIVEDFLSLLNDPRLELVNLSLQSTKDMVEYCLNKLLENNILTNDSFLVRKEQILSATQI